MGRLSTETLAGVPQPQAEPRPPGYRAAAADPSTFAANRICALTHDFHRHPLMQLPELARLAAELYPTNQCRFLKPGTTQSSAFDHAASAHDGRDVDEVFRRIEEPGSWIALYNVETVPRYREFLNEVVASARQLVDAEQPGMFNVGGFIFISAPPSVTPFHIDRENNFWLQVAGRKVINVWDHQDRHVVAAPVVEEFILHKSLRDVKLKDEFVNRSHELDVGPGDGVYFPSTSPHMTRSDRSWTKPGDGVSISIGVVFYTEVTRRHAHVHAVNHMLRRLGFKSRFPGQSNSVDTLKYHVGKGLVWAMERFRGYRPPVGFACPEQSEP